jgi:hypothetical protein
MVEQGPATTFHLLEVPTHPLGTEEVLRHRQEVKCSNTSPKIIDSYMTKGAYFDKYGRGRTGSYFSISSLGGAHTPPWYRGDTEALLGGKMLQYESQNH